MAVKNDIIVKERIQKKIKGNPTTSLKEVKTDGTEDGAKQAVENLKKSKVRSFEVHNFPKGKKTVYSLTLGGKNYETKIVKL
jgi:hypothetical protein